MTTQQPETTPSCEAFASQLQVFASAWANVGGQFDAGDGMQIADAERAIVLDMWRRLHTENEQLRAGYDAARLEVASLQAQIEAVGAGGVGPLRAALAAPAQAVPAPGVEAVSEREFKQFLSDVLTAAGLVTHGKKCKDLGRRLGEMSMRLLTPPKTAAAPVQAQDALKEIGAIAVSALETNSRYIADWREDIGRIAAIAVQQGNHD